MPAGIETFGNAPVATVTSGGTTTGSTSFGITPATGSSWPAASSSATPNTFFRIVDQANPSEIMIVTTAAGGTGSDTWTVSRGAEGTTAIAHASGWTAVQMLTAGTFQNLKQASNAGTSAVTVANTTTETVVGTYQPVVADIVAGASFEVIAFGTWSVVNGGARPVLTWRLRWGGTSGTVLAMFVSGTNTPNFLTTLTTGLGFDINGTVTLISSTSATANMNWWFDNANNQTTTAVNALTNNTSATSPYPSTSTAITISGNGPLVLTAQWSAAASTSTLTAVSPLIYRAA